MLFQCKLAWMRPVWKSNWTRDLEAFQPKHDSTSSRVKPQQETCVPVALRARQRAPVCAAHPNESAFSLGGALLSVGVCLKNSSRKERCHKGLHKQKQRGEGACLWRRISTHTKSKGIKCTANACWCVTDGPWKISCLVKLLTPGHKNPNL